MSTPEGKVKRKVSKLLSQVPGIYYYMPVPSGYGMTSLDYLCCLKGKFFAIETKRPGGKPTDRQIQTIEAMRAAGAMVFVIDGDTHELEKWLADVQLLSP